MSTFVRLAEGEQGKLAPGPDRKVPVPKVERLLVTGVRTDEHLLVLARVRADDHVTNSPSISADPSASTRAFDSGLEAAISVKHPPHDATNANLAATDVDGLC